MMQEGKFNIRGRGQFKPLPLPVGNGKPKQATNNGRENFVFLQAGSLFLITKQNGKRNRQRGKDKSKGFSLRCYPKTLEGRR